MHTNDGAKPRHPVPCELLPTGIPDIPLGWFNDETVDRNDINVGADRANVIYDFQAGRRDRYDGRRWRRHH